MIQQRVLERFKRVSILTVFSPDVASNKPNIYFKTDKCEVFIEMWYETIQGVQIPLSNVNVILLLFFKHNEI